MVNVNNGTQNASGAFGFGLNGGTLNLNGGTFVATYTPSSANASTIHLNGGLIVNSTSGYGNNVGIGSTALLVQGGGARFNVSQTWVVTASSGLLHDSTGPATDGGLVVNGAGGVTLSAAGTFNGSTTVNGGKLTLSTNGALGTGDASVLAASVSLTIGTG